MLIVGGSIVWILQRYDFMIHRSWFKYLPKFLISNGVGLLIPLHLFLDGLAIFFIWLVIDVLNHHKKKKI